MCASTWHHQKTKTRIRSRGWWDLHLRKTLRTLPYILSPSLSQCMWCTVSVYSTYCGHWCDPICRGHCHDLVGVNDVISVSVPAQWPNLTLFCFRKAFSPTNCFRSFSLLGRKRTKHLLAGTGAVLEKTSHARYIKSFVGLDISGRVRISSWISPTPHNLLHTTLHGDQMNVPFPKAHYPTRQ